MNKHIKYLLKAEVATSNRFGGKIRFNRTSKGIVVSCEGYKHMDLNRVSKTLLKLGCKYNFETGNFELEHFDKMSGRTYVTFKEPVKRRKV